MRVNVYRGNVCIHFLGDILRYHKSLFTNMKCAIVVESETFFFHGYFNQYSKCHVKVKIKDKYYPKQ